jgi:hypothetical protein
MLAGLNKMAFAKEAVVERSSLLSSIAPDAGRIRERVGTEMEEKCVPQRTA